MNPDGYVSVPDAADLSGRSERQIWRLIHGGKVAALYDYGRPGDPGPKVEGRKADRVWVNSDELPERRDDPLDELRGQVASLRSRLAEAERRIATLEQRPNIAPNAPRFDSDAFVEKYGSTLVARPDTSESPPTRVYTPIPRPLPPLPVLSPIRGGVQSGSVRSASFAKAHGVRPTTFVSQQDSGKVAYTSIPSGASNGRQERWLNLEQQAKAVEVWQRLGTPYTPCAECPHDEAPLPDLS